MIYKVIAPFTDLTDNNHPYSMGDVFPRAGAEVSEQRFAELAGSDNKQGKPLIQAVKEPKKKKASKKPVEE